MFIVGCIFGLPADWGWTFSFLWMSPLVYSHLFGSRGVVMGFFVYIGTVSPQNPFISIMIYLI